MNVYATNTDSGYELQGSYASLAEAQARAADRGLTFAHWWADEEEEERPEWALYQAVCESQPAK